MGWETGLGEPPLHKSFDFTPLQPPRPQVPALTLSWGKGAAQPPAAQASQPLHPHSHCWEAGKCAETARLAPATACTIIHLISAAGTRGGDPHGTHLVLGASGQQLALSQPGDDGLGVAECHAGQGDAAALLCLHVLRWCLREGGGCWGGSRVLSPSPSHTVMQRHRDRGGDML